MIGAEIEPRSREEREEIVEAAKKSFACFGSSR
jgi:hypothetical protein